MKKSATPKKRMDFDDSLKLSEKSIKIFRDAISKLMGKSSEYEAWQNLSVIDTEKYNDYFSSKNCNVEKFVDFLKFANRYIGLNNMTNEFNSREDRQYNANSKKKLNPVSDYLSFNSRYSAMKQKISSIQDEYPSHKFIFLTLTMRNVEIYELKSAYKQLKIGIDNLHKHEKLAYWFKKSKAGSFGCFEYNLNEVDGTVNPHLHFVFMMPSRYFSERITKEEFKKFWQECLGVNYPAEVNVKAELNYEGIESTLSYIIKQMREENYNKFLKKPIHFLASLFEMKGCQFVLTSKSKGILRFMFSRPKKPKAESKKLKPLKK